MRTRQAGRWDVNRRLVAMAGAAALALVGCSSPTPTIPTPASAAKTSTQAQQSPESSSAATASAGDTSSTPLDGDACVEVTGADLDLAAASNTEDARTAADTLKKYQPPPPVQDAIEHFVGTGGAQFDDQQFNKYNDAIEKWVHQVCPS
jgi:uncharacterized lipoprotein YbaY